MLQPHAEARSLLPAPPCGGGVLTRKAKSVDVERDRALPREPGALGRHAPRLPRRPGAVRRLAARARARAGRRRRPRAERVRGAPRPRPAAARARDDRAQALGRALAPALRARPRARPRTHRSLRSRPRRLPVAPKAAEVDALAARRSTATARSACGTGRSSSSSTRPGCAARRRSASTSRTSTSSRSWCTFAGRAARSGPCRSARRPPTGSPSTSARRGRCSRGGAENAVFLSVRGRRLDTSTLRRLVAAPAPAPARVRHAPARGRRRPARDPGAARPQLALDDADLQPRGRAAAAAGLRPRAPAVARHATRGFDAPACATDRRSGRAITRPGTAVRDDRLGT